jgi:hypothetical protein
MAGEAIEEEQLNAADVHQGGVRLFAFYEALASSFGAVSPAHSAAAVIQGCRALFRSGGAVNIIGILTGCGISAADAFHQDRRARKKLDHHEECQQNQKSNFVVSKMAHIETSSYFQHNSIKISLFETT